MPEDIFFYDYEGKSPQSDTLANEPEWKFTDKSALKEHAINLAYAGIKELFCQLDVSVIEIDSLLQSFPACPKNTPFSKSSLRKLSLPNNKLRYIPKKLRYLKDLQSLDLEGNNLEEIPGIFESMKSLMFLNLSGNNLSEWPESLNPENNPLLLKLSIVDGNHFSWDKIEEKTEKFTKLELIQ